METSIVANSTPSLPEPRPETKAHEGNRGATSQLTISARRHEEIRRLLNRQGLANIDPHTVEGKLVAALMEEIAEATTARLPSIVKAMASEAIIESILLRRSLVTHAMVARRPDQTDTDRGKARRQALQLALSGIARMNDTILKYIKILGLDATSIESRGKFGDMLKELKDEGN
jgi:hypothetical protein